MNKCKAKKHKHNFLGYKQQPVRNYNAKELHLNDGESKTKHQHNGVKSLIETFSMNVYNFYE